MARLKPTQLQELRDLSEQAEAILHVLGQRGHLPLSASQLLSALGDTFAAQDLRAMRSIASDLTVMLRALDTDEHQAVLLQAQRRIGRALTMTASDQQAAAQIVTRGSVRNDREYYLLRNHLDRLEADGNDEAAKIVARILNAYRET